METDPCALCGQPVYLKGFTLTDSNGNKKFCCGGCLSLFGLMHPDNEITTIKNVTTTDNEETP
ncbi:metal-binding protein [Methylovulum psychrotolerans]|jgi:hypothetical protein|uniref:Metal-binding protein n=1 Tax=Methylovulum psychrotolerans TaxID=1704499 RepID=A0A1Z4BYQ6_9GAMM|nr:metal-binding protein [Methylovulum psychrotolerans]POZ53792.1 metal-binding protein [Methylovulum psychrotolerans]